MTTTVLIGTHGNKKVQVTAPTGIVTITPGHWTEFVISSNQTLEIKEVGDFIDSEIGVKWERSAPPTPSST